MEPTIQTDAGLPARSRPRALIAAGVLGATILLGGAASVFAASPSATPSASPGASAGTGSGADNGTTGHVCDRTDEGSSDSSSSAS